MSEWMTENSNVKKGVEFGLQREISSMTPRELLKLESINNIPIEKLNKYLKPVREYVEDLYREFEVTPDKEIIKQCIPGEEYPNRVWIDRGLIGPHDDIRQVLAYQRDFVDGVLQCDDPHKLIAGEMDKIFKIVQDTGSGLIEYDGVCGKRSLYIRKISTPVPALSPFMDGDGSNISIRVFDVTGVKKVDLYTLKDCEKTGKTVMLSGLNIDFAKKYGFYEEAESLLEYDDLFDGGRSSIKNLFTFLPEGLRILGITNMDLEELKMRYSQLQLKYKKTKG